MDDHCGGCTATNSYSLVAYLPEPLAGFVGQLRRELVPDCRARAHITILPPRPLNCSSESALQHIRQSLLNFQPFRIRLGDVRSFPQTNVVYLSIPQGRRELEQLHNAINSGSVCCQEEYPYHPHLTLAQQIDPRAMAPAGELVSQRWQQFPYDRSFLVDTLTFVQNTEENIWVDLAEISLGVPVPV